ncbi:MAG TPA: hypothetical protein VFY23_15830 [Candidatus Limnocylindrales bacterium]|nr:hypothetical protein [Candidatus Limnocylindrales bacterium]
MLAHLAADGSLVPGWPVHLPFAPDCQYLGVAADGSVRLVCEASDIAQPEWCCDTVRAFAVRPDGLPIAGWPVETDIPAAVRVVGDALVLVEDLPVADGEAVGSVRSKAQLTTIAADGTIETGAREPIFYRGGNEVWAIGADGLAYVTSRLSPVGSTEPADWTRSELRKLGPDGFIGGWMVVIEGIASEADVGPDGLAVLEVGVMDAAGTRVRSVDHLGGVVAESDALPYQAASSGLQCTDGPVAPLRANEGVVTLGAADTFFALDANLDLLPGWPYGPEAIQSTGWPDPGELDCGDPPARPVLAPDGTLYVPLAAPSDSTGGGLVAIARDGSTVAGWPVGLRRADSGFWTLALRANAGLFALAVEREAAGLSATLLAIDPDSTVRWRTTIVDP